MARKVLLVSTARTDPSEVRRRLRERVGGEELEVEVVAPASRLSVLEWLASDEEDARAEAEEIAAETAEEIDRAETKRARGRVGDVDPVQAIEDALRTFRADEIVLVTPPRDEKSFLERDAPAVALERFDLPVSHIVVDDGEAA